jgi:flagellar motor switch protein FliM
MRKIIDRALSQLNETWKQIMPLEPRLLQFEMNPLFVQIAPATETVILISFRIFNTKMEGSLDFCLPYLVLEKILPEMSAQGWSLAARAENQVNTPLMSRKIRQVDLPVSVVIDMLNLSIEELTTLQTGDIIRLDRRVHDELDIKIDNQTKYRGRPGRVGSRLAVQITSVVTPEEEIIDAE